MKNIKTIFLSIFIIFSFFTSNAAVHFTENFTGAFTTTFASGTTTLTSGSWDYVDVRSETAANSYGATGGAARINKNNVSGSYLITPSVNGVDSIMFYYRGLSFGSGTITIQKSVGGGAFSTIATQAFSGTSYAQFKFKVNDASNNIKFKILSVNSAEALIIDFFTITSIVTEPTLTVTPSSLTGFTYILGEGPSTSQSYTLSGSNLTGFPSNITVTAPTNYEISTNNSTFSNTLNVNYGSATLASTTIYVRLKSGLAVNTYNSENITHAGGGATTINVSCSGSVTTPPPPSLVVTPTSLSGFTYILGAGPSTSQSYTLSGSNLTGFPSSITVTAPTNYEISTNNSTFSNTLNVNYGSATLASTTIYVRLKSGLAVNTYNSENITHAGGGATTVNVSCSGSVTTPPPPSLVVTPTSLSGFTYILGAGPSSSQSYTLSGNNLTGFPSSITVTAPTNYEISTNNSTFSNSLNVNYGSATLASTTIYVRLKSGLVVNTYNSENITHAGGGATTVNVSCSGSVTTPPPPSLVVTPTSLSGFTYILGAGPSTSQSYTLSGSNLTGFPSNITVTAPTNYEISTNNSTFSNTLNINYGSATLASTTIYVRLKSSLAVNTYNSENITHAGGGATTINVSCSGSVTTPPPPSLVVAPTSLSGFTYILGAGPSISQSYSLSGSNLTDFPSNITVTAPTNYEISTNNSTFSNTLNVNYGSATLASTTIYVRLKSGLAVNTYNSENITHAGGGATTVNVSCSGSVTTPPPPSLVVTPTSLSGFTYILGAGPSTSQSYTLSGSNLTGFPSSITVTAPTNYEISTNNSTFSNTLNVNYGSATLASTTIYVRLKSGLAVNTYNSENITHAGGGATTVNVSCSGSVTDNSTPATCISEGFNSVGTSGTPVPSNWTFTNIGGTYTSAGNFGTSSPSLKFDFTEDIVETPTITNATQLKFWIKGNTTDAFSGLLVQGWNGVSWQTIENIMPLPTIGTTKTYNASSTPALAAGFTKFKFKYTKSAGNLAFDDVEVLCSGAASPSILVAPTNLTYGNEVILTTSTEKTYTLTGSNLTADIIVTAPTGYEISKTTASGFATTLNFVPTSGNVSATVYVRFKPTLVQTYNGNISNASTGAATQNVVLTGAGILPSYVVNYSVINGNGSIAATVDGNPISTGASVQEGKNVVFTATPIANYRVKEWKLNNSVIAGNTTNTYTLTSINANATVSVEFELIPITNYTVNFSVVNGSGSITATVDGNTISTGASVQEGKNIVFTATPNANYRVKEWKLNSSVIAGNTTNTYTLTSINANATVSVEFELIPITNYTVNFSVVNGSGSITATVDGNTISTGASVQEGKNIVFTATPNANYRVKEWKLNSSVIAGNTTNTYTLTSINANATVSVEFELIPITNYTVNFSVVNGNGSITATVDGNTISTGASVQEGKNIVFTATPNANYRVKEWKLNSSVIASNTTNTYTLTSINANAIVTVEFELSNSVLEEKTNNMNIYPNPVSDYIYFETNATINKVNIISLKGKIFEIKNIENSKIDISFLANGIYILQIYTSNGFIKKKIEILRK